MEQRICRFCKKRPVRTTKSSAGNIYYKTDCHNCCAKKYRKTHPEKVKEIQRRNKNKYKNSVPEMKKAVMEHINQFECKNCGISDIRVLVFHHRDPSEKLFNIAWGWQHKLSLDRMKIEAKKCDLLCHNCHTIIHSKNDLTNDIRWNRKKLLLNHLGQLCCQQCGETNIRAITFHHVTGKNFGIGGNLTMPVDTLIKEAEKCQIFCKNCHTILHIER